jgi:PD-(D/E)XK nuclease superfamily protein
VKVYETMTGADVLHMRTELGLGRDELSRRCEFPNSKSAARLTNIEKKDSWKEGDHWRVVNALRSFYADKGLPAPQILSEAETDGTEVHTVDDTVIPVATPATCSHSGGYTRNDQGVWVCAACGQESPTAAEARRVREMMDKPGPVDVRDAARERAALASAHYDAGEVTAGDQAILSGDQAKVIELYHGAREYLASQPGFDARAYDYRQAVDQAAALYVADLATTTEPQVEDQVEVAGITFTKVSDDPFPVTPASGEDVVIDTTPLDEDEEWTDLLDRLAVVDTSDVVQADYTMTNSEQRTFKRCRRKWWLEYYRELGTKALDFTSKRATGDRVHRALQAAYSGVTRQRVDPRDALERAILEDWTRITETVTDPTELAIVKERFDAANALERAMVEGYVEWLGETGADADYSVTGAEQVLSARFTVDVDGKSYLVELLGKLDARLRRRSDGALLFIDHKTVGNFIDVVPVLKQNEQMLVYVLLEALNATDDEYVAAALYNMLRRVKRTAQAKPPFFERLEVHHNVHEVASFRERLVGTTRDVLRTADALDAGQSHLSVAYPNPTNDCRYDCQFFKICTMFDDGSPGVEDMLAQVYTTVDPLARYDGVTPTRAAVDLGEVSK